MPTAVVLCTLCGIPRWYVDILFNQHIDVIFTDDMGDIVQPGFAGSPAY